LNPVRRLAVVAEDATVHQWVGEQLGQSGESWEVESYRSGTDAPAGMHDVPPQVVLLEGTLPDGCGIEFARRVQQRLPEVPVVMLAGVVEPEWVMRALCAGAKGCVVKSDSPANLAALLEAVLVGGWALCLQTQGGLLAALGRLNGAAAEWGLSGREEGVLRCLCENRSDKDVASKLGVSDETVHVHLRNVYRKMGVHDRKSAVEKFRKYVSLGVGGKWFGTI